MRCQRQKAACQRLVNAPTCGVNALSTPPKHGVFAGQGSCAAVLSTSTRLSLECQHCHQTREGCSSNYLLTLNRLVYPQVGTGLLGCSHSTRGVPLTNPLNKRLTCNDRPRWSVDTSLTSQVGTVDTSLTVGDTPLSTGGGEQ